MNPGPDTVTLWVCDHCKQHEPRVHEPEGFERTCDYCGSPDVTPVVYRRSDEESLTCGGCQKEIQGKAGDCCPCGRGWVLTRSAT